MKSSITHLNLIEPKKCIIEDLEILAFENEEELKYYTIWHEALVNKKKGISNDDSTQLNVGATTSSRTKNSSQSIISSQSATTSASEQFRDVSSRLNKQISKTRTPPTTATTTKKSKSSNKTSISQISKSLSDCDLEANERVSTNVSNKSSEHNKAPYQSMVNPSSSPSPFIQPTARALPSSAQNQLSISQTNTNSHVRQGSAPTPRGYMIYNSPIFPSLPLNSKQMMKYKLTKLYNKYRGRQMRRNFVMEKQQAAKIEAVISKSYLNSWLTYTALQALRLPDNNRNQLTAATTSSGKILTTMAQPTSVFTTTAPTTPLQSMNTPFSQPISMVPMINGSYNSNNININHNNINGIKKIKSPIKKSKIINSASQLPPNQKPPMHLVYIDPGNIITYSNRINPQQIIEYRKKPPIQPSSATSKKSSAASYDVYEIMEVLANTNKTNVTITRNANRPSNQTSSSNPSSIYSHSVNANTPGIVSTQLHLQAKSYIDLMSKFYAEEAERLEKEKLEMMNEPSVEESIGRYLKI